MAWSRQREFRRRSLLGKQILNSKMKRVFKSQWIYLALLCALMLIPTVLDVYVFHEDKSTGRLVLQISPVALIALREAFFLCRVTVTEHDVLVDYFFPFRKSRKFQDSGIIKYTESRAPILNRWLIGGLLETQDEKLWLHKSGTRNFQALNDILLERYSSGS